MGTKYSIAAVSLDCLPECAKKSFLYKQRGASRAFWRGSMSVLVSPFLHQSIVSSGESILTPVDMYKLGDTRA